MRLHLTRIALSACLIEAVTLVVTALRLLFEPHVILTSVPYQLFR